VGRITGEEVWELFLRRRCLAGVKPRVLLYGSQNGVCSAAARDGDQVRKRVLGVGRFVGKHGDGRR
jgi:hypothetical protein